MASPFKIVRLIEDIGIRADIVILEGFSRVLGRDKGTYKIIMAGDKKELQQYLDLVEPPILALVLSKIKEESRMFIGKDDVDYIVDRIEKLIKKDT